MESEEKMKAQNKVQVPRSATRWSLEETPMSVRLRNALLRYGYRYLGELHGLERDDLAEIKGLGTGSLVDLDKFLERLRSGEFEALASADSARAPRMVVGVIDDYCRRLDARERNILLTRLGGRREPRTLESIGDKYGLTRERVRQIMGARIHELKSHGGPPFHTLLRQLLERCEQEVCPLLPETIMAWCRKGRNAPQHAPVFYVRLLRELMPELPAWPDGRRPAYLTQAQARIAHQVKVLLKGMPKPVRAREVLRRLRTVPHYETVTARALLGTLHGDVTILLVFPQPGELWVQPPPPEPVECVRQLLEESVRPLPLPDLLDRARDKWGDRAIPWPALRLSRSLTVGDGFHLFGEDTYGLRKHIRVPEALWARIRDDVAALLQQEGWSVSTFEILARGVCDWARATDPYELAVILAGDARLANLGRCMFALTTPMPPQPAVLPQPVAVEPAVVGA
jgi:hypothetical protein